jgi:hypothetical protein
MRGGLRGDHLAADQAVAAGTPREPELGALRQEGFVIRGFLANANVGRTLRG